MDGQIAKTHTEAEDSEPVRQTLFRTEVLEEQQTRWLGTVLLAPQISYISFSIFAIMAALAVLALLFFGTFTRKARISGWLVPRDGLIRIFAPQTGVVSRLYVHEGSEVGRGDPLLVLSTELQSEALGATRGEILRRLAARRDSLLKEKDLRHHLHLRQMEGISVRLSALALKAAHVEREIAMQRDRLRLAELAEGRQAHLSRSGYASQQRVQEAEDRRLDQALSLGDLERQWASITEDQATLESEQRTLPLEYAAQLAEMDRSIATLEQEAAEVESQREIVIPAPQNGTVTAIQADLGGYAGTSAPLLSIVPAGSQLEAQLFCPTRAIGFVRVGQRVLLRYLAFPYQKFGHYEGMVASVSRSAINPGELTQQLSGLTSLFQADEPVYRITVTLHSQSVLAYGEPVALQPGMQLEADVVIENRRLFEWVLDPLYSISGKLQG